MRTRTLASAGAALALAGALALSAPLAASAHVRVDPDQAQAGGYSVLTFRVPNESATAGTVKVKVDLPTATPFTSVSYQPIPGWTATVTTSALPKPVKIGGTTVTEAPTSVVWTADPGTQVGPGQFQQFVVSAGPVPDTGAVRLPTTQTYSDGTVVAWDQATDSKGTEPEHPAPTLYINDAPPGTGHGSGQASGPSAAHSAAPSVTTTPAASTADTEASDATAVTALAIGLAGVVLGAVGLVVAALALTRMRAAAARGGDRAVRGGDRAVRGESVRRDGGEGTSS